MSAYALATIDIMRAALDDAWESLSHLEQSRSSRSQLAVRVLAAAADGERDFERLKEAALGTYFKSVMMN